VDDPKLLETLRTGDRQAWSEVLRVHLPALVGYATRMLGDKGRGEDAVQTAVLGVLQTFDRFEGRCSLRSWLFRAVHHRAIDLLRANARYVPMPDQEEPTPFNKRGRWAEPVTPWNLDNQLHARRVLELVGVALEGMPHAHREIILLKDTHDLGHAEIAEVLGISVGNARIRLHRARKMLRAQVDRALEEPRCP
jgi:RNA polymerase sigma-70 factor, ECF subfamily